MIVLACRSVRPLATCSGECRDIWTDIRMSRIVVLGGSVAGLVSAMQLARCGFDVTVLEREARSLVAPPVDGPVSLRTGAPHAVHGHSLLARAAVELRWTL